jgi:Na+/glutamate symporter
VSSKGYKSDILLKLDRINDILISYYVIIALLGLKLFCIVGAIHLVVSYPYIILPIILIITVLFAISYIFRVIRALTRRH